MFADLDGDGAMDVVSSCEGGTKKDGVADVVAIDKKSVIWYRRTGNAWSDHVIPLPEGVGGGKSAVTEDVDGDGDLDVLCCEERDQLGVFWYENPFGRKE